MVVGITGKSGSGKTTTCENLQKYFDKSIIVSGDSLHKTYLLENKSERLIELFGNDIIIDDDLNVFYLIENPEHTRLIFRETYEGLERVLLKKIQELHDKYKVIFVDFFLLPHLQKVMDICDYRILIEILSDAERYQRIIQRDIKRGQVNIRPQDLELPLRDFDIPNYEDYSFDYYLSSTDDQKYQKDLEIIIRDLKRKCN